MTEDHLLTALFLYEVIELEQAATSYKLISTSSCNQSGARGSYVMTLSDSDFEVSGQPKAYLDKKTDSGTALQRFFCGECGSPIMSVTPLVKGKSFIKMGLFPKIPAPAAEVYTKNRDEWEPALPNAAQIEGNGM